MDGDCFRQLPSQFRSVYKQLCEGYFSDLTISNEILKPVKKSLKNYGDEPIKLINQAGTLLSEVEFNVAYKLPINWSQVQNKIENLVSTNKNINKRGAELAVRAIRQQLEAIRNGNYSQNLVKEITEKYLSWVYVSDFEQRIPLIPKHHKNLKLHEVERKLESVRPQVEVGLKKLAGQIVTKGTVEKLILRNSRSNHIELSTSIFNLGDHRGNDS